MEISPGLYCVFILDVFEVFICVRHLFDFALLNLIKIKTAVPKNAEPRLKNRGSS